MAYTFDDNTFSDLHKDVYGFRPRGHHYDIASNDEKQKIWDELCEELEANNLVEQEQTIKAVARFEARIADVIELGAGNRTNALLWMVGTETFYHIQDVEHFVWEQGILFTNYGKLLVNEIAKICNYKDYDYA